MANYNAFSRSFIKTAKEEKKRDYAGLKGFAGGVAGSLAVIGGGSALALKAIKNAEKPIEYVGGIGQRLRDLDIDLGNFH